MQAIVSLMIIAVLACSTLAFAILAHDATRRRRPLSATFGWTATGAYVLVTALACSLFFGG
jgi:hypothetical protein